MLHPLPKVISPTAVPLNYNHKDLICWSSVHSKKSTRQQSLSVKWNHQELECLPYIHETKPKTNSLIALFCTKKWIFILLEHNINIAQHWGTKANFNTPYASFFWFMPEKIAHFRYSVQVITYKAIQDKALGKLNKRIYWDCFHRSARSLILNRFVCDHSPRISKVGYS